MTHDDRPTPHDRMPAHDHEDAQVVDAKDVRSASPGRRIMWILILSAGAAAILLLGMWALSNGGFASQNPNAGEQAVDARAFSDDAGDIPASDAPTTATGEPTNPATGDAPNVNAPTVSAE